MRLDHHRSSVGALRIDALTGIRGFACLWVAALHSYPVFGMLYHLPPESHFRWIRSGYLAVDMFFILSGFILTFTYDRKLADGGTGGVQSFLISRIFRIFPLHWLMLLCLIAMAGFLPTKVWNFATLDWQSFMASVFLVQSWGFSEPVRWNYPAWSMSIEWGAYLVFPGIVMMTRHIGGPAKCLVSIALSLTLLAGLMTIYGNSSLDHTDLLAIPRCLLEFFAGAWLCRLFRSAPVLPPASFLMTTGFATLAVAVFVPRLELVASLGFCLIILGCARGGQLSGILFGNRIVMFLGEISFSLYMTHAFVTFLFKTTAPVLVMNAAGTIDRDDFAAVFVATLFVVPIATWRYIELPGQALGRRINRHLQMRRAIISAKTYETAGMAR